MDPGDLKTFGWAPMFWQNKLETCLLFEMIGKMKSPLYVEALSYYSEHKIPDHFEDASILEHEGTKVET